MGYLINLTNLILNHNQRFIGIPIRNIANIMGYRDGITKSIELIGNLKNVITINDSAVIFHCWA